MSDPDRLFCARHEVKLCRLPEGCPFSDPYPFDALMPDKNRVWAMMCNPAAYSDGQDPLREKRQYDLCESCVLKNAGKPEVSWLRRRTPAVKPLAPRRPAPPREPVQVQAPQPATTTAAPTQPEATNRRTQHAR